MKIVLATSNLGKISEFKGLLEPLEVGVVSQAAYGITSPPETGQSFVENALIKARHASTLASIPSIADDSGLVVRALEGEPGIKSARYSGQHATDKENVDKLLDTMKAVPDDSRQCKFVCVLVYLRSRHDPAPLIATGFWNGFVLRESRGLNGFGYDSIFGVPGTKQSAAQLTFATKNRLSHRGVAVKHLLSLLEQEFGR